VQGSAVTGLLLAIAASGAWGVSDFLGGLQTRRVPLPIVLAGSQVAALVVLLGLTVGQPAGFAGGSMPVGTIALAAAAGGCGVAALGLLYFVMARAGIAVVAPISAGAALISVLVGLAQGERLGLGGSLGVGLALIGTVAASGAGSRADPVGELVPMGSRAPIVLAAVGCALCAGAFFVIIRAASGFDPLAAALVNRVTGCALVLAWALGRWPELARVRQVGPLTLAAVAAVGAGDALADLCFASASTRSPLSVVTPLSSLYPAVAVLLALVILRERLRPLATVGVCSALIGVVLLGS
jgi:drug/metabolite transporter (DMT)-like permease